MCSASTSSGARACGPASRRSTWARRTSSRAGPRSRPGGARRVASATGREAMRAARAARAELGAAMDGPLPDLIEAVEAGGVQVVVDALGADLAGACIQLEELALLFLNGAQALVRQ